MTIQLAPEDQDKIAELVKVGLYADSAEVIHEALRVLEERARVRAFRAAVEEGEDDYARGDVYPWTPEFMSEIRAEAEEMRRTGERPDPDILP